MDHQLNPDRRSRQARSPRLRAVARAEGRKKFRRPYARDNRTVYTPTKSASVWLGRTCYSGEVYQREWVTRVSPVRQAEAALVRYRQSFDRPSDEGWYYRTPNLEGGPRTPAERAHEKDLERRWVQARRAFKRWEARKVGSVQTARPPSLIG